MNAVSHENLRHAEDLVFFEQWLRFYFIAEEDGKLYLRVPENELSKARALYPKLIAVADALNNREINHQSALEALHSGIMAGPCALSGTEWAEILAGQEFRLTVRLLSFWVQAEEDALDAEILAFHEWQSRFKAWRETPSIKDYAARFMCGSDAPPARLQ